jgi:hypothetical protein
VLGKLPQHLLPQWMRQRLPAFGIPDHLARTYRHARSLPAMQKKFCRILFAEFSLHAYRAAHDGMPWAAAPCRDRDSEKQQN